MKRNRWVVPAAMKVSVDPEASTVEEICEPRGKPHHEPRFQHERAKENLFGPPPRPAEWCEKFDLHPSLHALPHPTFSGVYVKDYGIAPEKVRAG